MGGQAGSGNAGLGSVQSARFMPDGRTALVASVDGVIRRVDLFDGAAKPKIVFEAFGSVIHRVALSPNGSLLALSTARGAIVIVDVESGKKVHEWKLPGGADVAFAWDGRHVATGNADATVYLLRMPLPEPPAKS